MADPFGATEGVTLEGVPGADVSLDGIPGVDVEAPSTATAKAVISSLPKFEEFSKEARGDNHYFS